MGSSAMMKSKYKAPLLWGIFTAYSMLTLLGALNHEVWLDEAQAWVILRDTPLAELPYRLKVEGHPPLWYVILYPFVKLGFPAEYAPVISWFFMASGALVLLFKVELPLPLKAVMLASSGFLYFNSVMLRAYCLIPLLLFLILWAYPKRREHAVIYGLLIALLANTHIFISGIVGILGIFMLYELFSEWRKSSKGENIGKLAGLAIAGIGVLVLVIPLIGSIEANSASNQRMAGFSFASLEGMFFQTFNECFFDIAFLHNVNGVFSTVLLCVADLCFVSILILLRHWRRAFAVELGFLGIYYVTCGLLWVSLPNRAAIFILSFAFALCLTNYEKPVFKEHTVTEKITGNIRRFVTFLLKTDKNAKKVFTGIVTAFFAVSVPSGAILLYKDIGGNFSGAKDTANYITENFDKNAVFVQLRSGMPEISFYNKDIKIFAASAGDIETYSHWEYLYNPKLSEEDTLRAISEYDELYIIYYCEPNKTISGKTLYIAEGMREYSEKNSIGICEYNSKEVINYIEAIKETHK